ncbi:MAG: RraA family protein [Candidatus Brockarchaeota archaeon]|nr:RraA family protein [Candidatus Brockarchaeota archaeon]
MKMSMQRRAVSNEDREILKRLSEVRTADVIDALDRYNFHDSTIMSEEIRPLFNDIKMVGIALTIRLTKNREPIPSMTPEEYDNYAVEWYETKNNADLFLKIAEPGHVLVVDGGGYTKVGFWGSYLSLMAMDRGIVGVVIDGGCRDVAEVRRERFPVFCRWIGRTETIGRLVLRPEDVNIPVTVGDVLVEPGDFVMGDDDGVVVIPREIADPVSKRALRQFQEDRMNQKPYLDKFGIRL